MIFAALDCSFGCSLAVKNREHILFAEHLALLGRESDRQMAPWLQQSFAALGLDIRQVAGWSLGLGPGSFAGLRCGIALVKGVCLASQARIRGLPSSYALAAACSELPPGTKLGVLHDARQGQLILSTYLLEAGMPPKQLSEPCPLFPEELLLPENRCQAWTALAKQTLPSLPEEIEAGLQRQPHIPALPLLQAAQEQFPWPTSQTELAQACEPLYVRQAVFVKPAELRPSPKSH